MPTLNPNPDFRDPELEKSMLSERGSIEAIDPLNAAPPGHSLTDNPGKASWERPPIYSDPEKAFDFVAEKIQKPDVEDNFLKLIMSGTPIEAIVITIAFAGFTQGYWTPDVAEMLKPPLVLHFIGLAVENEIRATVFNEDPEDTLNKTQISDEDTIAMMKENRPDLFNDFMLKLDAAEQAGDISEEQPMEPFSAEREEEDSFLTLEEEA